MLGNSTNMEVANMEYTIAYTITQNVGGKNAEEVPQYGIRCELLSGETTVSSEEISEITPSYEKVCSILQKLEKNQVFPAHLRDVIEDLLMIEYTVINQSRLAFDTI